MPVRCRQSQIRIQKQQPERSCLPSFQLFERPERFIAMSGIGAGSDEHCENGWPTLRKRQCLLQHLNCFFGLMVGDEHEAKIPRASIVRLDCQHAVKLASSFVITAGVEQNPPDFDAGDCKRISVPGRVKPKPKPRCTALTDQPMSESGLRNGGVCLRLECAAASSLGLCPVILTLQHPGEDEVRFGEFGSSSKAFRAAMIALRRAGAGGAPTRTRTVPA